MKIKDLRPADYNPRKISKKQLEMLKKSMAEFGDLSGLVINIRSGNIICGHQRIKNLDPEWLIQKEQHIDETGTIAVGHIETPFGRWQYREVDWDEAREKAANISANKHGGEWDLPKLDIIINKLQDIEFDIELTGFDLKIRKSDNGSDNESSLGNIEYQIIIKCKDEKQQIELIQELEERGLVCQPLIL